MYDWHSWSFHGWKWMFSKFRTKSDSLRVSFLTKWVTISLWVIDSQYPAWFNFCYVSKLPDQGMNFQLKHYFPQWIIFICQSKEHNADYMMMICELRWETVFFDTRSKSNGGAMGKRVILWKYKYPFIDSVREKAIRYLSAEIMIHKGR